MAKPLMPKATAVWLVDNTALTFDQIAEFCGLHTLEVKGIADGEVAQGIKGMDPVANGQISREELDAAQSDPTRRLNLNKPRVNLPEPKKKAPRYTPVSRRQDRPDAITWLLRYHPEITDPQISKLIGTTKPTIQAVRERTHWNSSNLKPVDPVTLGLCTQLELDAMVQAAADKRAAQVRLEPETVEDTDGLRPIDETLGYASEEAPRFEDIGAGDEATAEDPTERGGEIELGTSEEGLDDRP
ncbi:MAG: DUF1013 domain-containing protein [Alphaproteobacteria bacterium]